MSERPDWVKRLHYYMTDSIIDGLPDDGSDDALHDDVIDAVNAVLCGHYGHTVVDDQCGRPEHRYCLHCNRREAEL